MLFSGEGLFVSCKLDRAITGRCRLRAEEYLLHGFRFITLVRYDAIRQLVMNLAALQATKPTHDEQTLISSRSREFTVTTADNDKLFTATRTRNHEAGPGKWRHDQRRSPVIPDQPNVLRRKIPYGMNGYDCGTQRDGKGIGNY